MNIGTTLQSRVRQLLELSGGPHIDAIESVQPVAVVAQFPNDRQPQLESGDMLIRKFYGHMSAAAVALEYAMVAVRVSDPNCLVWITRIHIMNETGGAVKFIIGRGANVTADAWGNVGYSDCRLPVNDICPAQVELHGAHQVGFPIAYTRTHLLAPTGQSTKFDVDYILINNGNSFIITSDSVNETINGVSIEGTVFSRPLGP